MVYKYQHWSLKKKKNINIGIKVDRWKKYKIL